MSALIKHLVERLRARVEDWDSPIGVHQGTDWGGETGCSGSTLEVDWEKLEAEMAVFEAEFKVAK